MIEFTLFGIPVRVHPTHWIGLAIIGGLFHVRSTEDLYPVLFFMIAGFIGILSHEMGHALVGRKFGKAASAVDLIILGGYTQYFGARFDRTGRIMSVLAGPAATVVLGIASWIGFVILFGNWTIGTAFAYITAYNPFVVFNPDLNTTLSQPQIMLAYLLGCFMFISVWWSILNMLPIMPLDGGQFLSEFVRSPKRLHLIGAITACIILLLALLSQSTILALFMAFMAFENFKAVKQAPF